MRIVSLLPSATEIVCALGLRDQLVGVTHECDHPPDVAALPKVTQTHIPTSATSAEIDALVSGQRVQRRALYSLDFAQMQALRPDLIVTQTLCDVCAVDDVEVKAFVASRHAAAPPPRVVYLEPTRFDDVMANITQVAAAAGAAEAGAALVSALRARIAALRRNPASGDPAAQPAPRLCVLEWLDPPFSCGHWTPELVALAGGVEPLAQPGARSRRVNFAEIAEADPEVLLIACCGFSIERTLQDVPDFLRRREIAAMRCVREGRVFVTDGSAYFSRPGPRLVDSAEICAAVLWSAGAEPHIHTHAVRRVSPAPG